MIRVATPTAASPLDAFCKRALDIGASLVALVVTIPLMAAVALAVVCDSGQPVLYRGWRVGREGRIFRIVKFRTMACGTGGVGGAITVAGDPRVTCVGRLLRRTKLDELPQLFNVLRGDMSLVGPRPEHPNYVRLYTDQQRRVLGVRPGITGAASLLYRNEENLLRGEHAEALYRSVILPDKLRIELDYLERRNFWKDARLILVTLGALSGPAAVTETTSGSGR
jgi:lipopolysaccharide/colanic/teichoic acid biosynthesis glycosyltransferase